MTKFTTDPSTHYSPPIYNNSQLHTLPPFGRHFSLDDQAHTKINARLVIVKRFRGSSCCNHILNYAFRLILFDLPVQRTLADAKHFSRPAPVSLTSRNAAAIVARLHISHCHAMAIDHLSSPSVRSTSGMKSLARLGTIDHMDPAGRSSSRRRNSSTCSRRSTSLAHDELQLLRGHLTRRGRAHRQNGPGPSRMSAGMSDARISVPGRQHHHGLDQVPELAHVARPMRADEPLHRLGGDAPERAVVLSWRTPG